MHEQAESYGLILVEPTPQDYIFGGRTEVLGDAAIDVDDWEPWYSPGEYQFGVYFDTWGCVTWSAIKVYSAMRNYAIAGGVISNLFDPNPDHLPGLAGIISRENVAWLIQRGYVKWSGTRWYFDASERFTAKKSGTVIGTGNSAQNVWNSIRHDGLVPQDVWPYPREQRTPPFTAEEFYTDAIPQDALDLGLEYKVRFPCQYEQVMIWDYEQARINAEVYGAALRRSPLQIFGHAWDQPVNGVYLRTTGGINHAYSGLRSIPRYPIFDSYPDNGAQGDFVKQLAPDYILWAWAFKPHITDANIPNHEPMTNVKIVRDAASPKVYLAIPIRDEASFESYCENFAVSIVRRPDGKPNIEAMLQGNLTLGS